MDFQIILLPRVDYWEWVRACRDYVMRYSANLTSDPGTAARYMAPLQVVSFPNIPGAFGETGDLVAWFAENHEGIWLDPIDATSPDELQKILAERVEADDRFGQKQREFYLLWPSEYPVITQAFGANKHIYTRFGMPGHEGLDIRAMPGSNIYCCADGWVYRVHRGADNHAYGIHVRIQHEGGYKTVYAHLKQADVEVGQQVKAGELIGKADTTGATTGAHLHLTLKKDGATAKKETKYPKDVIDPTPFMVLPDRSQSRGAKGIGSWPDGICLLGAHLRVGSDVRASDIQVASRAGLQAVRVELTTSVESVHEIRRVLPEALILVRAALAESDPTLSPTRYVRAVQQDIARHHQEGIRQFELIGPANLQTEGWNRIWRDGTEFSDFLLEVFGRLRDRWPDIELGFPGLSPGGYLSGWRADSERFLEAASGAVSASDWLGVHCHWRSGEELRSPQGGRRFLYLRDLFPEKALVITEFNNPDPDVEPGEKARQYLEFHRMSAAEPAVRAVFAHTISAESGYENVVWGVEKDASDQFADLIRERARKPQIT